MNSFWLEISKGLLPSPMLTRDLAIIPWFFGCLSPLRLLSWIVGVPVFRNVVFAGRQARRFGNGDRRVSVKAIKRPRRDNPPGPYYIARVSFWIAYLAKIIFPTATCGPASNR